MLAHSASLLNVPLIILDSGTHTPAKQVIHPPNPSLSHIDGSFADPAKIRDLASRVDILTVEIEHVHADALMEIQNAFTYRNLEIHPDPRTIKIIQDKFLQKMFLQAQEGCHVAPFMVIDEGPQDDAAQREMGIRNAAEKLGLPLMLKSRTLAYDGRGNFVLRDVDQIQSALAALGNGSRPLYAEKWVPFKKEIAVMVVKGQEGVVSYPVVETVHKDNICHLVFAPLRGVERSVEERAREMAERAVDCFAGRGVFGVEMFLMEDGTIYINEIAPRPHNSGHYTIEACHTSQFTNHLLAILSLPLGSTALKVPSAAMLNLVARSSSFADHILPITNQALRTPGTTVHLYGKTECRPGRKMGHITLVADSDAQIRSRLRPLLLLSSSSSSSEAEATLYAPVQPTPGSGHSNPFPLVSIIMGSDSDLPTLLPCARILDSFSVPYELTIVSAHRTPQRLFQHAHTAVQRGIRVIIAAAGGAAHLPGMVAALTPLPVIGVPVRVTGGGGGVEGLDSLLSIVQMPRGVPVATVAIGNGMNAGLLAVRMLGAAGGGGELRLLKEMEEYMENMRKEVEGKVERVEEVGWEEYVRLKSSAGAGAGQRAEASGGSAVVGSK
ncbi:hypothetical protein AMATHDRAFT_70759 [Amanita thiersii Skay4041]|uniref:Phosphoribosylaminoimidazole carboxylase n=1 Tax=Amanita thiersii Skay4041 TaxID=703135 RepID=A0A2A9NE51_9AGAR|nr:hypothetical protein AMATHDRAFT_70759 [Amanita thiersii Skay4041]